MSGEVPFSSSSFLGHTRFVSIWQDPADGSPLVEFSRFVGDPAGAVRVTTPAGERVITADECRSFAAWLLDPEEVAS